MSPLRLLAALAFWAVLLGGCDTAASIEEPPPSPWLPDVQMAPADTSGLSDSLRAVFLEDAQRLALRRIHGLVDFGLTEEEEPVEIPEEVVTFFFDGLVHIYNATHLPAWGSVFGLIPYYQVHTSPRPSLYELTVGVAPETAWLAPWEQGEPLTGNPTADSLVLRYDLSLRYLTGTTTRWASLRSSRPLNARALAAQFLQVPGAREAYASVWNPTDSSRPDLVGQATLAGAEYLFRLGWGDCPAGCTNTHSWGFAVAPDGTVGFLGSTGDEVPAAFYP